MKSLQEIKDFALSKNACASQYNKFCEFIDQGDHLKAWQTVLGNIEWLNDNGANLDVIEICGLAKGVGLRWYSNGKLREENNYVNGQRHGARKEWYSNGKLEEVSNYVNGLRQGIRKAWYDNDNDVLWVEENYLNGQRHGVGKVWHENGELWIEENWVNGQRHGARKEWHDNGMIMACW